MDQMRRPVGQGTFDQFFTPSTRSAVEIALDERVGQLVEDVRMLCSELSTSRVLLVHERKLAAHWKANHDNQVKQKQILSHRLDLPLERTEAAKFLESAHARSEEDQRTRAILTGAIRILAQAVRDDQAQREGRACIPQAPHVVQLALQAADQLTS